MAEIVLSTLFEALLEKLTSQGVKLFMKSVNGGKIQQKSIRDWKRMLKKIYALLKDAEEQQVRTEVVRVWLEDLRDLAYDMEDLLDLFATEAKLYQLKKMMAKDEDHGMEIRDDKLVCSPKYMVQSICACGSRAAEKLSTIFKPVNQDIQSSIDGITKRLQDIETDKNTLGLSYITQQQQPHQTEAHRNSRESTSLLTESEVYGRGDDEKDIIGRLLKDEQHYENYVVIPIVGKGGIGKTTLAQCVYNNDEVTSHFDLKAWVCVSDVIDVKRITNMIINSATKQQAREFSDLGLAQEKLQELVARKKFLIVLDDIWSENYNHWVTLQIPFNQGAKGSRVIATTRNEKIAKMMMRNPPPKPIIHLQGLSKKEIWSLFLHHANNDSQLVEMRDGIVEKCKGLPLAAKALGGLFRTTMDKSRRQRILDSDIWNEDENEVLPVLRLSYLHLPPHLKRVFAYTAMFPKDTEFTKEDMVLRWMAEGFLGEDKERRMEDTGEDYFLDLVSRSLYEPSPSNETQFIMHDLIHDLAQQVASVTCHTIMDTSDMQKISERTRHMCFGRQVGKLERNIKVVPEEGRKLRSLVCNDCWYIQGLRAQLKDLIQNVRYLRVLELRNVEIEVLPDCIGDLKLLRLLDLSFTRIKELPESICNLQTLRLYRCEYLKKLPANARLLINLRHLKIKVTALQHMPMGIGKLTKLQTLDWFVLGGEDGSTISELRNLNHLHGKLNILGLKNVTRVEDAEEAQLHKKYGLEELHLQWDEVEDGSEEDVSQQDDGNEDVVDENTISGVLEQLKPHSSINKCALVGYMGLTLPAWLGDVSLKNMMYVQLVGCTRCESLPPLGQLPSLKNLWVEEMDGIKEIGEEFYGSSIPFQALRKLSFSEMENWEKWVHSPVDNHRAFTCLEKLTIRDCNLLKGDLPPYFSSLKTLKFLGCKELKKSTLSNCLEKLNVENCDSLVAITEIPLTLRLLTITGCKKVEVVAFQKLSSISVGSEGEGEGEEASMKRLKLFPPELPFLILLTIYNCPSLVSLPPNLLLPALIHLEFVNCKNMDGLPGEMHNFTSLNRLVIVNCPKIPCFPEGGLPRNLKSLCISKTNIKQQAVQEWGLHLLHSLHSLSLADVGSCTDSAQCLSLPSSLSDLYISGFRNLKSFVGDFTFLKILSLANSPKFCFFSETRNLRIKPIPEWGLHLLTSLQQLTLVNVDDTIECIPGPDLYLPSSLSDLYIEGFSNLKTICCSALPNLTLIQIKCCRS